MHEANEAAINKGERPVFDKGERLSELKELIKKGAPKVSQTLNYEKGSDLPKGAVSGHRSYKYQGETLFAGPKGSKIKKQGGISQRRLNSALPGCSQHHTGRAFDALSVNDSWWKSHKTLANWLMNPKNQRKFHYEVPYHPNQSLRNVEPWHLYFPK
jgi:LAS superfamily LD-carboxypeptidase LdcB